MRPGWKRVAERAANPAFALDEITQAIIPALEQDCRAEMSAEFIGNIRTVFDEQDASLFKADLRPKIEALRRDAGCGVGRVVMDNLCQISANKVVDLDCLVKAMTYALADHAARGARQVEEHYCRESTEPRAHNTRARIEHSIAASPIEALARQILNLDARPSSRPKLRQQGLDDGARL